MIRNLDELATSGKRRDCLGILEAGLEAAQPEKIIPRYVRDGVISVGGTTVRAEEYSGVYVVAFGKAADAMTRAFNAAIPINAGIVVIPKGSRSRIRGKKFQIFNARHPKPDKTSVRAAREVMKFLQNRRSGELVVFLVSGGGSSLLAMPDGISLNDKIRATDLLVKSGATIQEINCVRKHLSRIKGGRMVENLKCRAVGLIMSDVEGDDVSSIASGMTCPDDTTPADAMGVVERHGLGRRMPEAVLEALGGSSDDGAVRQGKVENHVIARNMDCLKAMEDAAGAMGYEVSTMQVFGDIKDAVKVILERVPDEPRTCLVFGGEVTVKVLGKGTGGRAQEMVLRILKNTRGGRRIVVASIGTDGIDGNSLHAGAITENIIADKRVAKEFLKNSDSGRFFQKRSECIMTGPTHTNLMDVGVILS